MPLIDYTAGSVQLRFALLGPAGAGKRTLLHQLHVQCPAAMEPEIEEGAVGLSERLSLRFSPESVEALDGYRLRTEMFVLSGPPARGPLFERLYADLDAVLFVADSRPEALAANAAALREAGAHALLAEVPVVIFYNQRDRTECTPIAKLEGTLNGLGAPSFGGSALTGAGLEPLLEALMQMAFAVGR